jgi:hypothetical protein
MYFVEDEIKFFESAYPYVQKLLFTMHENPELLMMLIKANYDDIASREADSFVETFSTTFFDDILSEHSYSDLHLYCLSRLIEVIIFLEDNISIFRYVLCLKIEFEKIGEFKNFLFNHSYAERLLLGYFRRYECFKYGKYLVKGLIIRILNDAEDIELDPEK